MKDTKWGEISFQKAEYVLDKWYYSKLEDVFLF